MAVREKPWDCALSSETGNAVRKRRLSPDGVELPVGKKSTRAGMRFEYPWSKLMDGDFFIVPIHGSRNSMTVGFRQAAARHDIEISISEWQRDGEECFRVIRVIGGIRKIKAAARTRGVFAPSSDIEAYYRRQAEARRAREGVDAAPATTPPAPLADAPGGTPGAALLAPLGTDAVRRYDRDALMTEQRKRAAMELAGLDPDEDEDFMGVGNGRTKI